VLGARVDVECWGWVLGAGVGAGCWVQGWVLGAECWVRGWVLLAVSLVIVYKAFSVKKVTWGTTVSELVTHLHRTLPSHQLQLTDRGWLGDSRLCGLLPVREAELGPQPLISPQGVTGRMAGRGGGEARQVVFFLYPPAALHAPPHLDCKWAAQHGPPEASGWGWPVGRPTQTCLSLPQAAEPTRPLPAVTSPSPSRQPWLPKSPQAGRPGGANGSPVTSPKGNQFSPCLLINFSKLLSLRRHLFPAGTPPIHKWTN
jgi:hypothetical protein